MILTTLPNELLSKILEMVDASCTLTNVSLTCKHLNDIAEPLMYRGYTQRNKSSMGRFAKALVSRPHLIEYVKFFDGSTSQPSVKLGSGTRGVVNLRAANRIDDLTNEQSKWIRQSLPDAVYGTEFCDVWYRKLTEWFDNWDAVLGFLFHICSRSLTSISLQIAGPMPPYSLAVLEQAIKEQHISVDGAMLANLREVHLKHDSEAGKLHRGLKASFVFPFFRLKCVVAISMTRIHNDTALTSEFSDQHVSAIKYLTLIDSRLPRTSVQNVLRCFNSLQFFQYQHTRLGEMESVTQFCPTAVLNGLDRSKHCLEQLILSDKGQLNYMHDTRPDGEYEPAESFEGFRRLRSLSVDAYVLLGPEEVEFIGERAAGQDRFQHSPEQCLEAVGSLPLVLEELRIMKCRTSIFSFLGALMPKNGPGPCPKLKSIHLVFGIKTQTYVVPNIWTYWKEKALERGIVLTRTGLDRH